MRKLSKEDIAKERLRCGKDLIYFIDSYVLIKHPVKGIIPFSLFDYQKDTLKQFQKNRFNIILKARQLGLSTLIEGYCLWLMLFHRAKEVLTVATKQKTAAKLVKAVSEMYKRLPAWLQYEIITIDNQAQFSLGNGSSIKAEASSKTAGRSEALSLLVVDECVAGETKIKIRNKNTFEEREISIKDLLEAEYK